MSISIAYQENVTNQALSRINSYSLATCEVFRNILKCNRKGDFHPPRSTIAKGYSEKTATRASDALADHGIIEKIRPKNKYDTCYYKVTPLGYKYEPLIKQLYVMLKYASLTVSISFPIAIPDVPPKLGVRGEEISNCSLVQSLYNSPSLSCYPSARATQTETRTTRNKFPKRGTMEHEWLSPELKGVTELLNLNKWGQIKLSAFPKQALQHAAVVYRSSKSAKKDPFHWFREVCNEWCMKNNISPDYGLLYRLEAKYNMPENPTYVLEKRPSLIEIPPKTLPVAEKKRYPDWQGKKFFTEEEHAKNRHEAVMKFAEKGEDNIFRLMLIKGWEKQL